MLLFPELVLLYGVNCKSIFVLFMICGIEMKCFTVYGSRAAGFVGKRNH